MENRDRAVAPSTGVVRPLSKLDFKKNWKYLVGALVVVVAGIATGWALSSKVLGVSPSNKSAAPGAVVKFDEAGKLDPSFKYDTAEGMLVAGGLDNEGTHHLERQGGPSKNVYLTSSVIDMESFVGKKVQVWGETLASKKTGWLMDVAKVKVTE